MNVTRYDNMRDEQIIALIEDCVQDGLNRQEEICSHLQEMNRRGKKHKLHKHPLYKWFNEISDRKLTMAVVALFSGKRAYLDHLVGRSIDMQKSIVAERELDVAQFDRKTRQIVDNRKPAIKLSIADFQRVFPKGKSVATLSEQRKALEVEMAQAPVTHTKHGPIVRANKETGVFMVGTTKVPLSVVVAALTEIGAQVTLPIVEN